MVVTVTLPRAHDRLLLVGAVAALRAGRLASARAAAARLLRRLLLLLPLVRALARLVPVGVALLASSRVVEGRASAGSRRLLGLVVVATRSARGGGTSSHRARRALTTLDGGLSEAAGWLAVVLLPLAAGATLVVATVLLVVVGAIVATAAVLLTLTRANTLARVTTAQYAGCLLIGRLTRQQKSLPHWWRKEGPTRRCT